MSPSYRVVLSQRALADLATKVRTDAVREHLHEVARLALDDHEPPDGGMEETPKGAAFWRRGLTVEERSQLNQYEQAGNYVDDGSEKAYHFGFTYTLRWRPLREFYILAVWHIDDMKRGMYGEPGSFFS